MELKKRFIEKATKNDIFKIENVRTWSHAALKYQGMFLNDKVLPGPDLLQKLIGTVFNFQERAFAPQLVKSS